MDLSRFAQLSRRTAAVAVLATPWMASSECAGQDWPGYRGNSGRTSHTAKALPKALRLRWSHDAAPPAPAWPAPARKSYWQRLSKIEPRVTDDKATHPVVSGGRVLFSSSRQDEVVCLDAQDGRLLWRVVCDGPVRYAPVVSGARVYFGSDDGSIRCVSLKDGSPVWRQQVGPDARMIPGNGRLISPYPVRTGVLLENNVVYACAGLFPMQGVFATARDARTGAQVWHRRLSGSSPQGYPLATAESVIFPNGRANPFSLRKRDGANGRSYAGVGGTFAVIADQQLVAGRGNDNTLATFNASSAARIVNFPGKDLVVTPSLSVVIQDHTVVALDRMPLNKLREEQQSLARQKGPGAAERKQRLAAIATQIEECALWHYQTKDAVLCGIAAGDTLYLGFSDRIERRSLSKGKRLSRLRASGAVVSMAAGDGQLIATTRGGRVLCYGTKPAPRTKQPRSEAPVALSGKDRKAAAVSWIQRLGSPRGYAVLVEPPDLAVAASLLAHSELQLLIGHTNLAAVLDFRRLLRAHGVYGSRATVHHLQSEARRLPYVSDFANLVVDQSEAGWPADELDRVTKPDRGLRIRGQASEHGSTKAGVGSWTHQYANPGNTADSQDQHITSDLTLQWFGGPGPHRMIDRHLRGPPPLASNGRMFLAAENGLIGVDAHNGTELWDLALPDSQRYGMPYDAGYIACDGQRVLAAVDTHVWEVDPDSGHVRRRVPLPSRVSRSMHWGYVAIHDGAIYGTSTLATAPRTTPGREQVSLAYRSDRPLVTSRHLFRLDPKRMSTQWIRDRGAIVNPSLAISGDRIFFIESRNKASRAHQTGRIELATLLASDAWLVALHAKTGKVAWEAPLDLPDCRNIVYLTATAEHLILVGSRQDEQRDSLYHLRVMSCVDGREIWRARHPNMKPGQVSHGEQVHHPVVMGDLLIAEPFIYSLRDGTQVNPDGQDKPWVIRRPGHSCGTMSGANGCLFFRADNPTVLDLSTSTPNSRFTKLAPSRAGCWINIIPACGLVLIPEASASCVCHYALQTSMAFRPRSR